MCDIYFTPILKIKFPEKETMKRHILLCSFAPMMLYAQGGPPGGPPSGGGAPIPSIVNTIVNYVTSQISVSGQNFSPTGARPTVTLNNSALVPSSFGSTSI